MINWVVGVGDQGVGVDDQGVGVDDQGVGVVDQGVGAVDQGVGMVFTPLEEAMSKYSVHSSQTSATSSLVWIPPHPHQRSQPSHW